MENIIYGILTFFIPAILGYIISLITNKKINILISLGIILGLSIAAYFVIEKLKVENVSDLKFNKAIEGLWLQDFGECNPERPYSIAKISGHGIELEYTGEAFDSSGNFKCNWYCENDKVKRISKTMLAFEYVADCDKKIIPGEGEINFQGYDEDYYNYGRGYIVDNSGKRMDFDFIRINEELNGRSLRKDYILNVKNKRILPGYTYTNKELLSLAKRASYNSYSKYSQIRVGAALITNTGKVYLGTNVENESYGLTICAERVAVFKAVSCGDTIFRKIAVYSPDIPNITPCGACRQVIRQFGEDIEIICEADSIHGHKTISDYLPSAFKIEKQF